MDSEVPQEFPPLGKWNTVSGMVVPGREMLFEALLSVAEHLDCVRHLLVLKKPQQPWWTQQQQFRHSEVEMLWEGEQASMSMCVTTAVLFFWMPWEDSCLSYEIGFGDVQRIFHFLKGGLSRLWENSTVEESITHSLIFNFVLWEFLHSSHHQLLFVCSILHIHQHFQQLSMIPDTVWC